VVASFPNRTLGLYGEANVARLAPCGREPKPKISLPIHFRRGVWGEPLKK